MNGLGMAVLAVVLSAAIWGVRRYRSVRAARARWRQMQKCASPEGLDALRAAPSTTTLPRMCDSGTATEL